MALHGIEPATFERCALIRDWLEDHGVGRVTLLVIPARDLHPMGVRSPEMVDWLSERRSRGDSIAQHGFQHVRAGHSSSARQMPRSPRDTAAASSWGSIARRRGERCNAGWRVLKLAGIEPDGFVAPSYAYTSALRHTLSQRFSWWAGLLRVHRAQDALAANELMDRSHGGLRASLEPRLGRAVRSRCSRRRFCGSARCCRRARCVSDIHPTDLQHPHHMMALEWVLGRVGSRRAVTYRELAGV